MSKQQQKQFNQQLITLYRGQVNHYNRGLARITGQTAIDPKTQKPVVLKSNGNETDVFQVPEAYEYAPSFQVDKTGQRQWVLLPGQHTPLGWAQASLAQSTVTLQQTSKKLHALGLFDHLHKALNHP